MELAIIEYEIGQWKKKNLFLALGIVYPNDGKKN